MSDTRKEVFKKIHERCFKFGSCNYKETGCSDCPINVILVKAETLLGKQEQGLLIDVPVKPEDDIYFIKLHFNGASRLGKITVDKITIDAFEIRVCGYWHDWEQEVSFTLKEFNKTWFLTKAEAEEALAKMGGSHE